MRAVPQQLQQIRAQPQVQHVTARVVGTASTAGGAGGGAAASSTTTTGQFIQVQPQQTLTPQRCIIQGPTLTRLPATTVASPVAAAAAASGAATAVSDHQPKISTIIQQKLATATPVQQVQQQQSTDLIRQLNLARAQGLVVLQQVSTLFLLSKSTFFRESAAIKHLKIDIGIFQFLMTFDTFLVLVFDDQIE